jgi:hypothetical protein
VIVFVEHVRKIDEAGESSSGPVHVLPWLLQDWTIALPSDIPGESPRSVAAPGKSAGSDSSQKIFLAALEMTNLK